MVHNFTLSGRPPNWLSHDTLRGVPGRIQKQIPDDKERHTRTPTVGTSRTQQSGPQSGQTVVSLFRTSICSQGHLSASYATGTPKGPPQEKTTLRAFASWLLAGLQFDVIRSSDCAFQIFFKSSLVSQLNDFKCLTCLFNGGTCKEPDGPI